MDRYVIRLQPHWLRPMRYMSAEIWRLSNDVKVHEEWTPPIGYGPVEAERIRKLLEAVPDDQAEATLKSILEERQREAVVRVRELGGFSSSRPNPD